MPVAAPPPSDAKVASYGPERALTATGGARPLTQPVKVAEQTHEPPQPTSPVATQPPVAATKTVPFAVAPKMSTEATGRFSEAMVGATGSAAIDAGANQNATTLTQPPPPIRRPGAAMGTRHAPTNPPQEPAKITPGDPVAGNRLRLFAARRAAGERYDNGHWTQTSPPTTGPARIYRAGQQPPRKVTRKETEEDRRLREAAVRRGYGMYATLPRLPSRTPRRSRSPPP